MAFAREVVSVLRGVEGAELLSPDPDAGSFSPDVPHADFLVRVLDLRLRLILTDTEDPHAQAGLARRLLEEWPDSGAVAVIEPADQLRTRVFEPFDVMEQFGGGATAPSEGPGPLKEVLVRYLHVLTIDWPSPGSLAGDGDLSLADLAAGELEAAKRAVLAERPRVTEKLQALELLAGVPDGRLAGAFSSIVDDREPPQAERLVEEVVSND